ncbi:MAG: ArsR/SmtB family transcription factor [Acidimicrobiales bacterium]
MPDPRRTPKARKPLASCGQPLLGSRLSEPEAARLAQVFAALSDPVRLRLVSLVAAGGEVCSCELEAPLGRSQPTISHHTKVLSEVGILVGERRGRWTWWRVDGGGLAAARAALDA